MLGDADAAGEAVREVFTELASRNDRWPEWHTAVERVHARCRELTESGRGISNGSPATLPQTGTLPQPDDVEDGPPIGSETIRGVFVQLAGSDQKTLWNALAGRTGPNEWEQLADALEHLDIGLRNADIPGGGEFEWRT